MKKESFARKRIYPVFFMLAVTVIFVSVTSFVYTYTKERIRLNGRLQLKRAVLTASGLSMPADPAGIENMFDADVTGVDDGRGGVKYYEVREPGSSGVASYVVIYSGAGLWGEITASVGFDSALVTVRGVDILDQNETPGLGGRIDEPWFKEQFRGKKPPLSAVPEGDAASQSEFQGITGASYSTEAVQEIMNGALVHARNMIRDGD
jgi:Na+-transporting NADH:ubiquinone oxidoreductase subunit C